MQFGFVQSSRTANRLSVRFASKTHQNVTEPCSPLSEPDSPMSNVVSMATATAAAAARLCRSAGLRSHPFSLRPKLSLNFSTSATIAAARLFRSAALASPPPSFRPKLSLNFATSATIAAGGKLPDSTLSYFDAAGELHTITTSDLTSGKKVILFAVPGAFTPTCSQKHLPSFVEKAGELRAKGVDTIACVSVNDAFVMRAWKEALKVGDEVLMLSDGNGEFTAALGVEVDLRDKPAKLGVRSRRYAMLVEDGVVNVLNLEEGGAFTFSGAGDILKSL